MDTASQQKQQEKQLADILKTIETFDRSFEAAAAPVLAKGIELINNTNNAVTVSTSATTNGSSNAVVAQQQQSNDGASAYPLLVLEGQNVLFRSLGAMLDDEGIPVHSRHSLKLIEYVRLICAKDRVNMQGKAVNVAIALEGAAALLGRQRISPSVLALTALPHPVKSVDMVARLAAIKFVPCLNTVATTHPRIVEGNGIGGGGGPSSSSAFIASPAIGEDAVTAPFNDDVFTFLQKGIDGKDYRIRAACLKSLYRGSIYYNLTFTTQQSTKLLDILPKIVEDVSGTSTEALDDCGNLLGLALTVLLKNRIVIAQQTAVAPSSSAANQKATTSASSSSALAAPLNPLLTTILTPQIVQFFNSQFRSDMTRRRQTFLSFGLGGMLANVKAVMNTLQQQFLEQNGGGGAGGDDSAGNPSGNMDGAAGGEEGASSAANAAANAASIFTVVTAANIASHLMSVLLKPDQQHTDEKAYGPRLFARALQLWASSAADSFETEDDWHALAKLFTDKLQQILAASTMANGEQYNATTAASNADKNNYNNAAAIAPLFLPSAQLVLQHRNSLLATLHAIGSLASQNLFTAKAFETICDRIAQLLLLQVNVGSGGGGGNEGMMPPHANPKAEKAAANSVNPIHTAAAEVLSQLIQNPLYGPSIGYSVVYRFAQRCLAASGTVGGLTQALLWALRALSGSTHPTPCLSGASAAVAGSNFSSSSSSSNQRIDLSLFFDVLSLPASPSTSDKRIELFHLAATPLLESVGNGSSGGSTSCGNDQNQHQHILAETCRRIIIPNTMTHLAFLSAKASASGGNAPAGSWKAVACVAKTLLLISKRNILATEPPPANTNSNIGNGPSSSSAPSLDEAMISHLLLWAVTGPIISGTTFKGVVAVAELAAQLVWSAAVRAQQQRNNNNSQQQAMATMMQHHGNASLSSLNQLGSNHGNGNQDFAVEGLTEMGRGPSAGSTSSIFGDNFNTNNVGSGENGDDVAGVVLEFGIRAAQRAIDVFVFASREHIPCAIGGGSGDENDAENWAELLNALPSSTTSATTGGAAAAPSSSTPPPPFPYPSAILRPYNTIIPLSLTQHTFGGPLRRISKIFSKLTSLKPIAKQIELTSTDLPTAFLHSMQMLSSFSSSTAAVDPTSTSSAASEIVDDVPAFNLIVFALDKFSRLERLAKKAVNNNNNNNNAAAAAVGGFFTQSSSVHYASASAPQQQQSGGSGSGSPLLSIPILSQQTALLWSEAIKKAMGRSLSVPVRILGEKCLRLLGGEVMPMMTILLKRGGRRGTNNNGLNTSTSSNDGVDVSSAGSAFISVLLSAAPPLLGSTNNPAAAFALNNPQLFAPERDAIARVSSFSLASLFVSVAPSYSSSTPSTEPLSVIDVCGRYLKTFVDSPIGTTVAHHCLRAVLSSMEAFRTQNAFEVDFAAEGTSPSSPPSSATGAAGSSSTAAKWHGAFVAKCLPALWPLRFDPLITLLLADVLLLASKSCCNNGVAGNGSGGVASSSNSSSNSNTTPESRLALHLMLTRATESGNSVDFGGSGGGGGGGGADHHLDNANNGLAGGGCVCATKYISNALIGTIVAPILLDTIHDDGRGSGPLADGAQLLGIAQSLLSHYQGGGGGGGNSSSGNNGNNNRASSLPSPSAGRLLLGFFLVHSWRILNTRNTEGPFLQNLRDVLIPAVTLAAKGAMQSTNANLFSLDNNGGVGGGNKKNAASETIQDLRGALTRRSEHTPPIATIVTRAVIFGVAIELFDAKSRESSYNIGAAAMNFFGGGGGTNNSTPSSSPSVLVELWDLLVAALQFADAHPILSTLAARSLSVMLKVYNKKNKTTTTSTVSNDNNNNNNNSSSDNGISGNVNKLKEILPALKSLCEVGPHSANGALMLAVLNECVTVVSGRSGSNNGAGGIPLPPQQPEVLKRFINAAVAVIKASSSSSQTQQQRMITSAAAHLIVVCVNSAAKVEAKAKAKLATTTDPQQQTQLQNQMVVPFARVITDFLALIGDEERQQQQQQQTQQKNGPSHNNPHHQHSIARPVISAALHQLLVDTVERLALARNSNKRESEDGSSSSAFFYCPYNASTIVLAAKDMSSSFFFPALVAAQQLIIPFYDRVASVPASSSSPSLLLKQSSQLIATCLIAASEDGNNNAKKKGDGTTDTAADTDSALPLALVKALGPLLSPATAASLEQSLVSTVSMKQSTNGNENDVVAALDVLVAVSALSSTASPLLGGSGNNSNKNQKKDLLAILQNIENLSKKTRESASYSSVADRVGADHIEAYISTLLAVSPTIADALLFGCLQSEFIARVLAAGPCGGGNDDVLQKSGNNSSLMMKLMGHLSAAVRKQVTAVGTVKKNNVSPSSLLVEAVESKVLPLAVGALQKKLLTASSASSSSSSPECLLGPLVWLCSWVAGAQTQQKKSSSLCGDEGLVSLLAQWSEKISAELEKSSSRNGAASNSRMISPVTVFTAAASGLSSEGGAAAAAMDRSSHAFFIGSLVLQALLLVEDGRALSLLVRDTLPTLLPTVLKIMGMPANGDGDSDSNSNCLLPQAMLLTVALNGKVDVLSASPSSSKPLLIYAVAPQLASLLQQGAATHTAVFRAMVAQLGPSNGEVLRNVMTGKMAPSAPSTSAAAPAAPTPAAPTAAPGRLKINLGAFK